MQGYENVAGQVGLGAFVARADELAETYGDRFRPTRTCVTWPPPAARSRPDVRAGFTGQPVRPARHAVVRGVSRGLGGQPVHPPVSAS